MKNDKISFFERLTGGKRKDDESEIEVNTKINNERLIEHEDVDAQLAVDVYQTPSEIIVASMVAGVKPEDLEISITREMITIKGKRAEYNESDEDDYFHQELYWGSFSRTIMLPQEIDPDQSEAMIKHGLLTIRLPKINKERSKTLKVKSS